MTRSPVPWEEARAWVVDGVSVLPPTRVSVAEAWGHALAEDLHAPESMPPFDNTAMDGFALRSADAAKASPENPVRLRVVGDLPAGSPERPRVEPGTAVRVMTGAAIPEGADAVLPVEDTDAWDPVKGKAETGSRPAPSEVQALRPVRPGANVRRTGESVRRGEPLLPAGKVLRGPEIALLNAVGIGEVNVHSLPRVGVLTTGDELVPAGQEPERGQIRDSNRPGLLAAIRDQGFVPVDLGLSPDDEDELVRRIPDGARKVDFLLTSGGVSVGEFDLTRRVLDRVGDVRAYMVAVKPGRHQVFGHVGTTPVFGVPGNPVSSLLVFEQFVLPALKKMAGRRRLFRPLFPAVLAETVPHGPGRTEFVRVRLEAGPEGWVARPTGPQGSGILTSLTRADGYALIDGNTGDVPAGARVLCQLMTRD